MNEPNFYLKTMWQGVLAVVLCACFAIPARAQTPVVTLDARNVTIKELLQRIEAASPYTFAYVWSCLQRGAGRGDGDRRT